MDSKVSCSVVFLLQDHKPLEVYTQEFLVDNNQLCFLGIQDSDNLSHYCHAHCKWNSDKTHAIQALRPLKSFSPGHMCFQKPVCWFVYKKQEINCVCANPYSFVQEKKNQQFKCVNVLGLNNLFFIISHFNTCSTLLQHQTETRIWLCIHTHQKVITIPLPFCVLV